MGRGRGRSNRTQRRHFKQNRENIWKDSESNSQPSIAGEDATAVTVNTSRYNINDAGWNPFVTENAYFEEYYKGQGVVPPEEWDTFMEFLRKPLPSAFRINSSCQFYLDVRSQLENDFVKSLQTEFTEGDEAKAIRPLPWYPENLAWHSNFSRKEIRKNQTLERFHEFLKLANDIGNITRQEAVSMVPPLFLDVHQDHFVLDMCAAPGSKTFQLLEIIHLSCEPGSLPCGMVIANDVDIQRSNLLIHQTKRMCTSNLVVTNHEAQNFPGCNLRKHNFKAVEARTAEGLAMNQLLFDRVLCDVPCSGDGTLRKAPDMWRRWNTGMGNGLHNLQVIIAMRGMSLLKVGGRMVYSTCSMNPVENEAVVAEILRRCKDSVELLDVSEELPQLIRRPGLKSWKVWDKGQWLASYKDVKKYRRVGILPSMFPSGRADAYSPINNEARDPDVGDMNAISVEPVSENGLHVSSSSDEEISGLPLERCMRIVPHDQNTGAFFIAVFHKLSPIPVGDERIDAMVGTEELVSCETINFEGMQDDNISDARASEAMNGESSNEILMEDSTELVLPNASLNSETFDSVLKDESLLGDSNGKPCSITEANGKHDGLETNSAPTGCDNGGSKRKLQIQGRWKGVDPVLFYKDENVINQIKAFYGIVDSFSLNGHLISRNIDNNHVKRIYYISKSVKDVLELNLLAGHQLKIASVGVKLFERQTSQDGHAASCLFRISSEGLPLLLPYITKQIIHVSAHDLKHLLEKKSVKFGDFVTAESGEKALQLMLGCCVVANIEDGPLSSDPTHVSSTIAIGCWRGRTNISVMVAANDCQDLLDRLVARMEAKGLILPKKVESTDLEVNGDTQCRNETKGEIIEAVKIDEVERST